MADDDGPLIRVALHTWPAWIDAPPGLDADTRAFLAGALVEVTEQSYGEKGCALTPDPGSALPPWHKPVEVKPTKPMPKGPCMKCKTMSWVSNGTGGWKCGRCRP